jgi:phosphoglycolate phosphatase
MMGQHIHEVPLIQGMDVVIKNLHAQGFHLFITSSNSTVNVKTFLKAKKLDGYFEKVYGGIGLFNKAGAIKRIIRQNHLQGELVIYVGDEARDVEGARRAGVAMAAVGWGINDPRLLALHHPNFIADSPEKLYNILTDPKKGQHSWKKL